MKLAVSTEKIANLAIIVVAALVMTTYVKSWTSRSGPPEPASARPPTYDVGENVPDAIASVQGETQRTLLIFINSHCTFCSESMPFYNSLMARRAPKGTAIVAVSRESIPETLQYVSSHGVKFDRVLTVGATSDVKLHLTPTMLLVEKSGRVVKRWIGYLDPSQQAEVLNLVQ
jgi:thioredoxin-related protein